jgi:2-polyprenyl-3-methyl-5-hydroxy-6-metoxy-1,4-benzoquinol methylase
MSIDDVFSFWNSRPCNVKHSSNTLGTKEYFDEVATKRYKAEPHIIDFMCPAKYNGKKVLELGCGIGTDAIQFAKAGANVTCVDLTRAGIDLCKRNFESHGLTGSFYIGNIETLNEFLPVQSFDLIYSFGVIHHTPKPENVIKHLNTYLVQGGEVKIMVYSKISYKLFWILHETGWEFRDAKNQIQRYSEAQTGCPVTYTYTIDEAKELMGNELNVLSIKKDHIFVYDIPEYVKGNYVIDKAFVDIDPILFTQLKQELGWHTLIYAVSL